MNKGRKKKTPSDKLSPGMSREERNKYFKNRKTKTLLSVYALQEHPRPDPREDPGYFEVLGTCKRANYEAEKLSAIEKIQDLFLKYPTRKSRYAYFLIFDLERWISDKRKARARHLQSGSIDLLKSKIENAEQILSLLKEQKQGQTKEGKLQEKEIIPLSKILVKITPEELRDKLTENEFIEDGKWTGYKGMKERKLGRKNDFVALCCYLSDNGFFGEYSMRLHRRIIQNSMMKYFSVSVKEPTWEKYGEIGPDRISKFSFIAMPRHII